MATTPIEGWSQLKETKIISVVVDMSGPTESVGVRTEEVVVVDLASHFFEMSKTFLK